jgi:hypothetical protein
VLARDGVGFHDAATMLGLSAGEIDKYRPLPGEASDNEGNNPDAREKGWPLAPVLLWCYPL